MEPKKSQLIHNLLQLLQHFSDTTSVIKTIHSQILANSLSSDQFLVSKLVKAYSDLGHLWHARQVFNEISQPKTILWNAMVGGCLRNEDYKEAVKLFQMMGSRDVEIDTYTCNFALKACMGCGDYEMGVEVIRSGVDGGMDRNRFFGSTMISFFVKYGNLDDAKRVFDGMREKDVVCWNSMIGGYLQGGCYNKVFDMLTRMFGFGIRPSNITIVSLIQACGGICNLELGRCIHGTMLGLGMSDDILVLTSLVDMYGKMGDIRSAWRLFYSMPTRNLISCNAMISVCIQNGYIHEAFDLFRRLMSIGVGFDSGTLVSILQGCAQIADLESGRVLHGCIFRRGMDLNPVLLTAVLDMYCKCGVLRQANAIFGGMKDRNVITWTAMLVGLTQNGQAGDALKLFRQMQEEGVAANSATLVSLIHSCSHVGVLKSGKSVHAFLIRHGYDFDVVILTALIDMYAKCGKLKLAECIFNYGSVSGDIILWNSMIQSYGMHGQGHRAYDMYSKMMRQGLKPNETTFVCLLTALSHSGLVEEGISLFKTLETDHNIRPKEKHYACMVDLLSRGGRLEEAEALIKQMPFDPGTAVLEAFLSGCRTHRKIDMGVRTADRLLTLDAMNPGVYVMLSNIYAEARRWDTVDYVRTLMRKRTLKKTPGYSSIEVRDQIHTFFVGDDSHPNLSEIFKFLEKLKNEVKGYGYVADTSCILRDVDEATKVKLLWSHSERLAIAFGLMITPARSLIRITKNLRVCVDCHVLTKYISKIYKREICVRDANRFHHFVDGKCSCGDYW